MNWTWNIRSRDGAMNGLEFARCTTAGGFSRVLVHAAPAQMSLEVIADDDQVVARGALDREGEYSPMTLVILADGNLQRDEVWPDEGLYGLPVLLAGGEVGILGAWHHADDHSWWQWSVEFSNHTGKASRLGSSVQRPGTLTPTGHAADPEPGCSCRTGAAGRSRAATIVPSNLTKEVRCPTFSDRSLPVPSTASPLWPAPSGWAP